MIHIDPIYQFIFSCVGFVIYNELVILPYYIWTPESMTTPLMMSQRNPLIHLSLLLINFGFICVGVKSSEKVFNFIGSEKSFKRFRTDEVLPKKDLRGKKKVSLKVDKT